MVLRARRLGQPDDMPVACYSYKGTPVYLTGKRIAKLFRKAVKAIHPRTSKAELSRYSAHLLQVWACVLLEKAGMSPEFIMARLRWMENSFRMYLWDTVICEVYCTTALTVQPFLESGLYSQSESPASVFAVSPFEV